MNPEITMNSITPHINKYRRQRAKYDVYELIKLIQEVETNPKLQELLAKEGGPTKGEAALDYVLNKMDRESLEKSPSSRPAITKYLRQAGEKNPSVFADLIQHVETNPEMQASLAKEGEPTKGAAALEHVLNKIDRKFAEELIPSKRSSKKTVPTNKMFPIKSTNDGKTRDAIVTSDQNSRKLYPKFETEGFNRKCDYAKKYATVVNSNLEKNEKAMISKERR
ncbi:hypothetical protein [Enterococcus sp. AZ084]|uniref:hypothetical protein n=1 Tax=Enterococcus sp. AZ084 TaxID=2774671 RepID=UPI003F204265